MPPKGSKKAAGSKVATSKKTATSKQSNVKADSTTDKVAAAKKTTASKRATTAAVNADSNNDIGNLSVFPAEIVLSVFSHLDYLDVKCCLMVCRGFKAYCDHPVLDRVMFRNVAPLAAGTKFKPKEVKRHYCLDSMSYECSTDINDAYMMSFKEVDSAYSDHGTYPLVKTSAINEYATMPAMKAIKIRIQEESTRGVEIKNESGVTVHDILKALVAYFSVEIPGVMLYDVCPWLAGGAPHFFEKTENCPATRRDMMGDHTGWSGFHRQTVDKNGVLMLVVDGFDS